MASEVKVLGASPSRANLPSARRTPIAQVAQRGSTPVRLPAVRQRWLGRYLQSRPSPSPAGPVDPVRLSPARICPLFLAMARHTRPPAHDSPKYSGNRRLWARSRGCVSIHHAVGWRGAAWRSLPTHHDWSSKGRLSPTKLEPKNWLRRRRRRCRARVVVDRVRELFAAASSGLHHLPNPA